MKKNKSLNVESMQSMIFKFMSDINKARSSDHHYVNDTNKTLTKNEALEILGLEEGATNSQINAAYHKLMKSLHPDKGGSSYFAQKLNQARDRLLK